MSTRLLLLRHAETADPSRYHGSESDVDLGPAGPAQADAAGRRIAPLKPTAVYCSTLRRARHTAERIALACGLTVTEVAGIHERRMGPLSGTPKWQGRPLYQDLVNRWREGDLDATVPGAESYREVRDRVVPALGRIAERHRGETVVVVAHGLVIRIALTSLLADVPLREFESVGIDYVAVNDLRWDGERWSHAGLNRSGELGADGEGGSRSRA